MMVKMVPADMRRAAAAWESASEQVERAHPVDRVREISTAMPGGASARQVANLVATFGNRFDEWSAGATVMGENYRAVADDHQTTDQRAGEEGRQHVSAVSNFPESWGVPSPHAPKVSSGPAVFDPGASASDRMTDLIDRLGKVGS